MNLGHAPGPSGLPLLGVWPAFRRNPRGFLLRCAAEYGQVCSFRLGTRRTYLVIRPDLIEEILIHGASHFVRVSRVGGVALDDDLPSAGPADPVAGLRAAVARAAADPHGEATRWGEFELSGTIAEAVWTRVQREPELLRRLRIEALALSTHPDPIDLPRLELITRTLAEALRLDPPAWAVGREVRREFRLFNYLLRAGTVCLLSPWVVQRQQTWWPQPEQFNPDRFSEAEERSRPKFAYFPFGGSGPVEDYCWTESVLLLATLVRLRGAP